MVQINRPENTKNQYSDIGINRSQSKSYEKENSIGDNLNKVAGTKVETRFVDRKEKETMGQDGFMKLLAHQLKNQDPMKPMDQKDFSANLAQFSQLEQLTAMNKKMDAVNQNAIDDKRVQGASFLGKKVITNGTSLDYAGDGSNVKVPFHLERPAKVAIINVVDNKNQLVARIERENLNSGMQDVEWNGLDFSGLVAAKETYRFEVIAFDDQNEKFLGETKSEGLVQGVSFDNGETILSLKNGRKVFLKDVQSFSVPENNSSDNGLSALKRQAVDSYQKIEAQ